ncbi:MAG: hypothetical protein ACLGGX_01330 [Bdellovibrionia bacterium]
MNKLGQMLILKLALNSVFAFFMASSFAFAQTSVAKNEKAKLPSWSNSFSLARASNLYDQKNGTQSESLNFEWSPAVRLTPLWALSSTLAYDEDLKYQEESDFQDVPLRASYSGFKIPNKIHFNLNLTGIFPVSKRSTKLNELLFAGSAALAAQLDPSLTGNWGLSAFVSLGQNFHQYETSISGTVLNQYVSNQGIAASYSWSRIKLSAEFVHRNALSYQGSLKESFEHTESLSLGINSATKVSIGHTNGGSIFKANGVDSNISLLNENASQFWMALNLAI